LGVLFDAVPVDETTTDKSWTASGEGSGRRRGEA
jgi:hypothetical protein